MFAALFAFAYPGECARLMVAHPGVEIFAPIAAVVSLALVWTFVWLLVRGRFAATATALVLACLPAFRLGFLHPIKANLLIVAWLALAVMAVGLWRLFRRKKDKKEQDRQARSRVIAYLGLAVIVVIAMYFKHWLSAPLSAVAAVLAGLTVAFWRSNAGKLRGARIVCWLVAFVVIFECGFDLCMKGFSEGAFADRMAQAVLDDMGERTWIVTDGALDDHLVLAARERGRELHVVSLARDDDAAYRKELAETVRRTKLLGDASEELALSLDLGVLQFVQDWFRGDPEVAKKCVVFGAPDLWYSAGLTPVPETLFFGGDPKREAKWSRWPEFDDLLEAPRNWGSYQSEEDATYADVLRLNLRRHLGLVANDRGVWLQDAKDDDQAFAMYRLVVDQIDRDNVSALINLIVMANAKYASAVAIERELNARMDKIAKDKNRRYLLGSLSRFYGYVRDPQLFVRLGFLWARSGMPETAMAQIRRAIDLVPTDRRRTLVNMLASLYADGNERAKSRRVYEQVLVDNSEDHEALIGLVRLSLLDGDQAKALEYLERATAAGGDDPRIDIERAMVAIMKNDLTTASEILRRCVDADAKDARALSLLAVVAMQRHELERDPAKRRAIESEIEKTLLPELEKRVNREDYYLNTVRAFVALMKGNSEQRRREARDAFVAAVRARPDIAANRDLVLGLDISLNDQTNAEFHARETLKVNRQSPIANYVMGSLALGKNDLKTAELYLKRAADCEKSVDLALNDLAETYRRLGRAAEALPYAERAVERNPKLYVSRATLAAALMDLNRDLPRALELMREAVEMSKVDGRMVDFRMYVGLARAQLLNGDAQAAKDSLMKTKSHQEDFDDYDKRDYEELLRRVR